MKRSQAERLDELERVIAYKELRPYITPDEAKALLETIDAATVVVEGIADVDSSLRDPDPNENDFPSPQRCFVQ